METVQVGTKVRVHKNLRRGDWSVTIQGKLVANVPEITLSGVTFYICESMRQRVIERNRRKVHAWAIGIISDVVPSGDRHQSRTIRIAAASSPIDQMANRATERRQLHFTATEGAVAIL
jgi:hypothetical protein